MALQFDNTIKAGDVLTSITVLLAIATLVVSLSKDRATRITDQANKVRAAAATTLVKLDRWQALRLSLYDELQPNFVELSEGLSKQYDVVATRDRFWKEVGQARAKLAKQILDEQLGTGYVEILAHFPSARAKVVAVYAQLAELEIRSSDDFMGTAEQRILSLKGQKDRFQTPDLGNALRESANKSAERLRSESERILEPVRQYLFGVIAMSDDEIVSASRTKSDA